MKTIPYPNHMKTIFNNKCKQKASRSLHPKQNIYSQVTDNGNQIKIINHRNIPIEICHLEQMPSHRQPAHCCKNVIKNVKVYILKRT